MGGVEVWSNISFNSVGCHLSASSRGRFILPVKEPRVPTVYEVLGPRADPDEVEKRKLSTLPRLELRPRDRPVRSQSLYLLSYPGSYLVEVSTFRRSNIKLTGCFLNLHLDPEDGGNIFLWNVSGLLQDYLNLGLVHPVAPVFNENHKSIASVRSLSRLYCTQYNNHTTCFGYTAIIRCVIYTKMLKLYYI
jgi:hypothetical protein